MNTVPFRILLFVVVFVLVLLLPWWLSLLILFGLIIYFPLYLEVLFFGLMFDTLYSVRYNFPYLGLSLAFVTLLVVSIIRTNIRT